ncbi:MAG: hypothetical protein II080_09315 [Lachnospiraceae bacterium]|nr:hypothetical protein [Lachnospiraceae bacterium]
MAQFRADISGMKTTAAKIVTLSDELYQMKKEMRSIDVKNVISDHSFDELQEALNQIIDHLDEQALEASSMGDALKQIAECYRTAEESIISTKFTSDAGNTNKNFSSTERGTDKRSGWTKFWDWILRKDPDKYDTTSSEQERAADEKMKKQLWKELGKKEYSQENWDKSTVAERKKILQDYMNEVIHIYGLEDVEKKIQWGSDLPYTDSTITWGYYNEGDHTVTLNEKALSDSKYYWKSHDMLRTVGHELRHAYQHEAISNPTDYMVSEETIDKWEDNFENYISFDDDHEGYKSQPVEVDARNFEVGR